MRALLAIALLLAGPPRATGWPSDLQIAKLFQAWERHSDQQDLPLVLEFGSLAKPHLDSVPGCSWDQADAQLRLEAHPVVSCRWAGSTEQLHVAPGSIRAVIGFADHGRLMRDPKRLSRTVPSGRLARVARRGELAAFLVETGNSGAVMTLRHTRQGWKLLSYGGLWVHE